MNTRPKSFIKCLSRTWAIALALSVPARASELGLPSHEATVAQSTIYRRARAAYEVSQYRECKRLLQTAGTLVPVMTLLLAQAECELREYRSCAVHTQQSLRWTGHKPELRIGIERMLAEASREIGAFILAVNVDDAEVTVDGQPVGKTPMIDPTYMDLGTRRVRVAKQGYKTVARNLESQKGVLLRVSIDLVEGSPIGTVVVTDTFVRPRAPIASDYASPKSALVREAPLRSPSPHVAILIAGGVGTIGGVMTGLYLNSKAHLAYDSAAVLRAKVGETGCAVGGDASSTDCQDLMRHLRTGDRARNYATVSIAAGATILASTALYWVWPRNRSPRAGRAPNVTAALAPARVWLGVSWGF